MESESESKVWAWQRVYARVKSLSMALLSMALSLFVCGVTNMEDEESGETPDPISPPFNQIRMNKYVYSM